MTDATERAVALAERYGEALVAISDVLANDTYTDAGKVMRVRVVLAGLDSSEWDAPNPSKGRLQPEPVEVPTSHGRCAKAAQGDLKARKP